MAASLSRAFWLVLAGAAFLFHLGLVFSGLVPNLVARPIHLAFALPWVLLAGQRTLGLKLSGALLCAAGVSACVWIAFNHSQLGDQYGFLEGKLQLGIAAILILAVLEGARRSIGWPLPLVALAALGYGLLGQHIPGEFGHSGTPIGSFLGTLTIAEGGLWGSLAGISVGIVSIFVILGAVLNAGAAGQGFMNLASAAAGRLKGGAAKVSILSSALFGSISGSASANVASTGAITMPAMLKLGYPPRLTAAVEAVASSGGQIMPPLMGAGAFVMVELTGTPYSAVMAAALLPAVLYFAAVWFGVNGYAARYDLKPIPADQQPSARAVAITSGFFLVPFGVLLWLMLGVGYTPQYSAVIAIIVAAALLLFDSDLSIGARPFFQRAENALLAGASQIAMIASIILCASIIIGVLGITGLGVKVTSLIMSGSSGLLWPALLLTAIACLILGMEVPTTAAYVVCVSVAGPALIDLGMAPLQAHLFIFWFALISTITPPVCGAVFIASGMIGANWLQVAVTAMSLGVGLYVIPLALAADPSLISIATTPFETLFAVGRVGLGLWLVSMGLVSSKQFVMRCAFIGVGVGMALMPFGLP